MQMKRQVAIKDCPAEIVKPRRGELPYKVIQFDYWEVQGQSHRGRLIKRDGKAIKCGHEHKSKEACQKCLDKMKKEKHGNCQYYAIENVRGYLVGYKVKK
jgi:hypothetical protein